MSTLAPLVLFALGVSESVSAQSKVRSIPAPTHDWGCEVLLCLANPNGPTAVAPCVPPIRRLWRELARGRPFPTCAMASSPAGRSFAQLTARVYDPCPAGTVELAPGQFAELAMPMSDTDHQPTTRTGTSTTYAAASPGLVYAGIGDGEGQSPPAVDYTPPPKVCVAGWTASRDVSVDSTTSHTVHAYDRIYVSPAQANRRVIDVYIDDTFWHSVRW